HATRSELADSEVSTARATPAKLPPLAPARPQAGPASSADAGGSVANGLPATTQHDTPGSGNEPKKGVAADPLARITPTSPESKASRPARARDPLFGASRDWILAVECHADMLILSPSDYRIAVTELSANRNGTNPLQETVSQLIARRQATVRPGE